MGSDSPYVTDTSGSQAPSPDSVTVQTADRSDALPTDTPPAAPDGGAGGGEAFDNPGADTRQQETTSEAGPDTPQQAAPAPDGGAGGGEAFDNPDSEATSPPGDAGQYDQRQGITANDQPNDPVPAVEGGDSGGEEAVVEPDDRNDSSDREVADDEAADSQSSAAPAEDRRAILPEAQKIAAGHAYEDHVVKGGEYPEISTPQEFEELVNEAMSNPTDSKPLERDRAAYWHDGSETVVIVDPNHPDGGTAFRPYDGRDYYDKQVK